MAFKFVAFVTVLAMANAGGIVAPVTYATSPLYTKVVNPSVDAVASTQQNVVRSFGGTVSSYSKSVDTPYSSVRKTDTRINKNVYTPAVAKTVTYAASAPLSAVYETHGKAVYAAPAHGQTVYAAPALSTAVYASHGPAKTVYAAPAVAKAVYATPTAYAASAAYVAPAAYSTPAITKTIYSQQSPVVYSQAAPAITKTVYSQQSPVVYSQAAPAVTKSIYSQQSPFAYSHLAPAVGKTVTYAAPAATTNFNHGPTATTYTHNAPGVASYGTSQTVHYSPAESVSHMSFDGFGTHWGI